MHLWMLDHLCCLTCGTGPLLLDIVTEHQGQVAEGELACPACGAAYPIHQGVPRFTPTDRYADTFSFQRRAVATHWDFYRTEDSATRLFPTLTPLSIDAYQHGVLLDAGCGYGRWVRHFSDAGVQVIGVDLSTDSINLCAHEYGERKHVGLVQADLLHLPFPQDHFAHIWSFGVLHHTPDTRKALAALVDHLRPGGDLSVWVYGENPFLDAWRGLLHRLPPPLLYGVLATYNYGVVSWVRHLGPLCTLANRMLPMSPYPEAWHRLHTDFDAYAPTYAHRTTYPTVYQWCQDLGLTDIQFPPLEIAITARKAR